MAQAKKVGTIDLSKVLHLNPQLAIPEIEKKKSKYNNTKVIIDGEKYDSIKEGKRRGILKMRLRSGEIMFLARQVEFSFRIEGSKICSYIADFVYLTIKDNELVVEDVKSEQTRKLPTYRLKKKMMEAQYGIIIKEV